MFDSRLVRQALTISLIAGAASGAGAQAVPDTTRRTAPNTELPLIPTRPLKFTTDELTWMSLDIAPDGWTIVFACSVTSIPFRPKEGRARA